MTQDKPNLVSGSALANSPRNSLEQLCGDPASPMPNHGLMSGPSMTQSAWRKPVILWRDKLLTVDCYWQPNTPLWLHLFCPLCEMRQGPNLQDALKVAQDKKHFELEPDTMPHAVAKKLGMSFEQMAQSLGLNHVNQLMGRLNVTEPIKCTWETEPELRRSHGLAVCNWRVVIENNIARDVK